MTAHQTEVGRPRLYPVDDDDDDDDDDDECME
jgi:hypothetical protein